jgi:hypothetical protein
MIISVEADMDTVSVKEPNVLTAFHVQSLTNNESVVASAIGDGAIPAEDAHLWVSIEWISANVAGSVSDDWEDKFLRMIEYATTKGWVNESGSHLKAHIEIVD